MHIYKYQLLSESNDCHLNTSMKSKTQIYHSFSIYSKKSTLQSNDQVLSERICNKQYYTVN